MRPRNPERENSERKSKQSRSQAPEVQVHKDEHESVSIATARAMSNYAMLPNNGNEAETGGRELSEFQQNAESAPRNQVQLNVYEQPQVLEDENENENDGDDDVFADGADGINNDLYDAKKYQKNEITLEMSYTKTYERTGVHLTSNLQTLMHILKGNIGTGVLALPIAMKYAGWTLGIVILLAAGVICTHCMQLVVACAHHLQARHRLDSLDFGQVGYLATKDGPASLRRCAKLVRLVISSINNVMQIGFCSVYLLFIAQNVDLFVKGFLDPSTSWIPPLYFYEVIVFLLLMPYQLVTNLDLLSYFSAFANALTFTGMIIILVYCMTGEFQNIDQLPMVGDASTIALAISICVFAFESINLILPVENKMRSPSGFRGICGVLQIGLMITLSVYTLVALVGYFRFGSSILPSITLSIPATGVYTAIMPLFAVSIFISYGLQMYVPATNFWNELKQQRFVYNNNFLNLYGDVLLRVVLLTLTFGLAALIPYLDLMISLLGALLLVPLGIIIPPVIQIFTMWPEFVSHSTEEKFEAEPEEIKMLEGNTDMYNERERQFSFSQVFWLGHRDELTNSQKYYWRFMLTKNIVIITVGFLAMVIGSYCSVRDIVLEFQKEK